MSEQSTKLFSVKSHLPTNSQKISPLKDSRYICGILMPIKAKVNMNVTMLLMP